MNVVLDASVLLKTILPDEKNGQELALNLFEKYSKSLMNIVEPIFWVFEIGNTVARKLPIKKAQIAFKFLLTQQFKTHYFNDLELLEITKFSSFHQVSFYDASYHLLAHFTNSIFVTADKKYYQKFKTDKKIKLLEDF